MMPQGAQPIIAPFWADLTATNNSITYGRSASALTIAYRSIKQEVSAGGGGTGMSFQTILYTNGQIRLQYSTMTGSGLNQAACGIQSESSYTNVYPFYTRTIGNASMDFVNNILITPVVTYYWLRTEPFSGTIVPGGVYTNSLTCNATNLVPGVYTIELPVSYSAGTAHVPVILSVTE
jgi:hypothetical protein